MGLFSLLCLQQEVISRLEELEHEMEPATLISDEPPSYHDNTSMISTPDTLSTFSDGHTNDEEVLATVSDPGVGVEGRNSKSPNLTYDDSHAIKTGFHQKLGKQWSAEVSLEGMLMSAAAAARKFTKERQKETINIERKQSVDSHEGRSLEQVAVDSEGNVTPDLNSELNKAWRKRIKREGNTLIQKKEAEISPEHSDESESRQSGNEGVGLEEETITKSVVAIDINPSVIDKQVSSSNRY